MEMFLPGILVIVVLAVGVGFLIRGVLGQRAALTYRDQIIRGVTFTGYQAYRFGRWTFTTHWRFWLGFAAGVVITLLLTGRI